ncbi:MAG: hypothetical protein ACYS4T_10400 [Planctomycetota bacterium]
MEKHIDGANQKGEFPIMSIENPTLAHFRHFSTLFTKFSSTTVEDPLQIGPFYAKQSQFPKSQMNVSLYNTMEYENKSDWTPGENKPNSKPIQSQSKPIAEMVKLTQSVYLQRIMKKNAE